MTDATISWNSFFYIHSLGVSEEFILICLSTERNEQLLTFPCRYFCSFPLSQLSEGGKNLTSNICNFIEALAIITSVLFCNCPKGVDCLQRKLWMQHSATDWNAFHLVHPSTHTNYMCSFKTIYFKHLWIILAPTRTSINYLLISLPDSLPNSWAESLQ